MKDKEKGFFIFELLKSFIIFGIYVFLMSLGRED